MKAIKGLWADVKVNFLNGTVHARRMWRNLTEDLIIADNYDLRLVVFIFVYLLFSLLGAYNFAHLSAFFYIIWLLERKHGN
jgi:hypothetical protein